VGLEARAGGPRKRAPTDPLFSELLVLVECGELRLSEGGAGAALDPSGLDLRDFHALRAIATRLGWVAEDPVTIACRNCGQSLDVHPCAALELGPFAFGELDDPELDATLDVSAAHPIPAVPLPGGGDACELRLRRVTVAEAAPLHRALRRRRLAVTAAVVRAMGIVSLGSEKRPAAIATALSRCGDEAWAAIGDWFLQAHYSPRLAAVVLCSKCGARNDVDAPYERDFEAFAAHAQGGFDATAGPSAAEVRLVLDDNVPVVDDGGEPLMGSYEPPGGDVTAPVGNGAVTLYYRTFRAIWDDDGPYDWKAEVDETLEHELEHHAGWRVGDDPMDDEERAEISAERVRLVGRRTAARQSVSALGADLRGFLARTWLIWLIVAAATLAITVCDR